jgi:hypothetical protein
MRKKIILMVLLKNLLKNLWKESMKIDIREVRRVWLSSLPISQNMKNWSRISKSSLTILKERIRLISWFMT